MVKFIESELILLKKEIDEMWTLVYNQLDRAGEAVLTLDKELAQQVIFAYICVVFMLLCPSMELTVSMGTPLERNTVVAAVCRL